MVTTSPILVDTDLVWMQSFTLLFCKTIWFLPAALGSGLGLARHWGHHLASSFYQKLESQMKWSQLDWIYVNTDLIFRKTWVHPIVKSYKCFVAICGFWFWRYHQYRTYLSISQTYLEVLRLWSQFTQFWLTQIWSGCSQIFYCIVKTHIYVVAVCGSWLGRYPQYSTYLAISHP
jgi:hypothetical protein